MMRRWYKYQVRLLPEQSTDAGYMSVIIVQIGTLENDLHSVQLLV